MRIPKRFPEYGNEVEEVARRDDRRVQVGRFEPPHIPGTEVYIGRESKLQHQLLLQLAGYQQLNSNCWFFLRNSSPAPLTFAQPLSAR